MYTGRKFNLGNVTTIRNLQFLNRSPSGLQAGKYQHNREQKACLEGQSLSV